MARVEHLRNNCIGCNSCVEHSKCNWKISEIDGKSNLIDAKETRKGIFLKEISDDEIEENKLAERDCPIGIIRVLD